MIFLSPALDFFLGFAALTRFGNEGGTRRTRTRMTQQRASVWTRALRRVHETPTRATRPAADFTATVWSLQSIELGVLHFAAETVVAACGKLDKQGVGRGIIR